MTTLNLVQVAPAYRDLIETYLNRFREYHNGDSGITADEARKIIDLDGDNDVDIDDWKIAATPEYPISQRNFAIAVEILHQALDKTVPIKLNKQLEMLDPNGNGVLFSRKGGHSLFESAKLFAESSNFTTMRVNQTPKADIHMHLGGNARISLLYKIALDRVGPDALNSDRWGGQLNWETDASYFDMHDFQRKPLDTIIRLTTVGKTITENDYVSPSKIIADGQEIERRLVRATPGERPNIEKEREANFKKFEKLATYKPEHDANLVDFLNIYRFASSLVEKAPAETMSIVLEDAMLQLSDDGVKYAEIKISAPSLGGIDAEAGREKIVEALEKRIEKSYDLAVAAIKKTNEDFIRAGKDPVDIRITYALSKYEGVKPKENIYQTEALILFMRKREDLAHWVVGIDGCAKEPGELPKLYEEHFKILREYNEWAEKENKPEQKIGISWHQGEDFSDTSVFDSIRRVDEIVGMGVDRLGHGIVLGISPERLLGQKFSMPVSQYVEYLTYEKDKGFKQRVHTNINGHKDNLEDEMERALTIMKENPKAVVNGVYPSGGKEADVFKKAIRERQEFVINHMRKAGVNGKGVALEINPTSNMYMATATLEDHPLPFFIERGLRVTINTDDAGTFSTNLSRELISAALMAKLTETQLLAITRNGFQTSFAEIKKGENLAYIEPLY